PAAERPSHAACRRPRAGRTASRAADPRDDGSPPESSPSAGSLRGSAGSPAWPDRVPDRPSPPAGPDAPCAGPPASPAPDGGRRTRRPEPAREPGAGRGAASVLLHRGLGARGPIVAVGDGEPGLGLLGHQPIPAGLELVDGDGFDHL